MKLNYIVKHLAGTLVFFALLFISAGTLNYLPGLIYLTIGLIMFVLNYTVLRIDPQLAEERAKPGEGTKSWDKKILGLTFLATISMYIIAGFDTGRFHWSPDITFIIMAIGIFLTITGQLLFLIAQKQNKFFSSIVRIQTDREHQVCETGLYSVVRHPAYLGSMIQLLGFPLLFGSLWSIIPVLFSLILHIIRTELEDKTLMAELNGYKAYSVKIRYKVVPLVW